MEMTWEEWKAMKKDLRRRFSGTGWTVLGYFIIVNIAVTLWMFVESLSATLELILAEGPGQVIPQIEGTESAWGYFLAAGLGLLILLLWKKPRYFAEQIMARGRPMTAGAFFGLMCVFLGGQFLSQMMLSVTEIVLNIFGFTILPGLEALTVDMDDFGMFLYTCILAPVTEEILFRGVVLRKLIPYGKRFAILCSAVTFGLFHGNLVQAPFAFLVGLVLGYVAAEYNICWAMLLHMVNNLVMADMLSRLTSSLPLMVANTVTLLVFFVFAVAALVILIVRRKDIRSWKEKEQIYKVYLGCFFKSAGMIAFGVIMMLMMVYTFSLLISPI